MRAVVTDGKGQLGIQNVPMPELDDYDALVKTEACVFCNSTDRHLIEGSFPFPQDYPAILGHESIGVVQAVGRRVRHVALGDRVLRSYAIYPGDTLDGLASAWGGFAEYGKVKDHLAMVDDGLFTADKVPGFFKYQQIVPPQISLEQALLMISQKEILSSVNQFREIEGRKFLVLGAGITALLFGVFLKQKGAAHVTFVARRQEPLDFAMQTQAADAVVLLADSKTLACDYDALVETTGSLETIAALSGAVVKGGMLYSYAIYPGMADDSLFDGLRKDHCFLRVDPSEYSAHDEVCRLVRNGSLNPTPFITHSFPFHEVQAAWQTVIGKQCVKTAVLF